MASGLDSLCGEDVGDEAELVGRSTEVGEASNGGATRRPVRQPGGMDLEDGHRVVAGEGRDRD